MEREVGASGGVREVVIGKRVYLRERTFKSAPSVNSRKLHKLHAI